MYIYPNGLQKFRDSYTESYKNVLFVLVFCCFVSFSGDTLDFQALNFPFPLILQFKTVKDFMSHISLFCHSTVLMALVNLSLCSNKLREDEVSRLLTEGMQMWVCAHQRKEKQV